MRVFLFNFISLILILATCSSLVFADKKKISKFPNIIFITLDAARADRFSGYGYPEDTTANIDNIGRKGAVFLKAFSQATYTIYSLPQIFTSRRFADRLFQDDAWRWGFKQETSFSVFRNKSKQPVMLTRLLSEKGYDTALFHNHPMFVRQSAFAASFKEVHTFTREPVEPVLVPGIISWLSQPREKPFFVYGHIMSPHEPYPVKSSDKAFLHNFKAFQIEKVRKKVETKVPPDHWTDMEFKILSGLYDSNLKYSDFWLGTLFRYLKSLGMAGNTILVISSDHGEILSTPPLFNRSSDRILGHGGPPWEGVIHVPLIFYYPHLIKANIRVDGLAELIDIMPTILDLAGIPLDLAEGMEGQSLLPCIKDKRKCKHAVFTTFPKMAVRTEKFKFFPENGKLFDLQNDPHELENIAANMPKVVEKLNRLIQQKISPAEKQFWSIDKSASINEPFYFEPNELSVSTEGEFLKKCNFCNYRTIFKLAKSNPNAWVYSSPYPSVIANYALNSKRVPISIAAEVPNGKYNVDLLVGIANVKEAIASESLVTFRKSAEKEFSPASSRVVKNVRLNYSSGSELVGHFTSDYLFRLGQVDIHNNKFKMDLKFNSRVNQLHLVYGVAFTPVDGSSGEPLSSSQESSGGMQETIKRLKSLGYM